MNPRRGSVAATARIAVLAGAVLLVQGCVDSGFYYVPGVGNSGNGANYKVERAPCRLPVGGPYVVTMNYPGLTLTASAGAFSKEGDIPTSWDESGFEASLMIRLVVAPQHSIVTDLSRIALFDVSGTAGAGLDGKRFYTATASGEIQDDRLVADGAAQTYSVEIERIAPGPAAFTLTIPSFILDGRELGPVTLTFRRRMGTWSTSCRSR